MMNRSRKIVTVLVLSLALAIIIIDTTLLNVSLGYIIRDLNTDIQSIQWVITAYSLTLAALTITGGRLGDLFGRKKMFVTGAAIFALGSFIASVSQNVATMIVGESIIEGVGAALMMPATASILVANFQGRSRAIAFGIWGGVAGASAAVGPILGGYLTTNYTWRWGFLINVFVAAVLIVGSLIIRETKDTEEKPSLDWGGVFLSATGLLTAVFGIIESSRYGWWKAKEDFNLAGNTFSFPFDLSVVPFAIVIGLGLLSAFLVWEKHIETKGETPLVSLKLFTNRQYSSGVLTTMVLSLGQTGIIFAIPVFLQAVRGLDAFETGVVLLPLSLSLLVVAPLGAFLSGKISPKLMIQAGLFFNIIAMWVLRQSISVDATDYSLVPGLILFGGGMGLVMSQINNFTISAVSVQEAGEASGVNNTLRQVGASLGSAIIGAVLIGALGTNLVAGVKASSVIPFSLKDSIAGQIASQTSNVEFGGGAKFETKLPENINSEIVKISHQATVDASKDALLVGGLFALLGFLVSFILPNIKNVESGKSAAAGH